MKRFIFAAFLAVFFVSTPAAGTTSKPWTFAAAECGNKTPVSALVAIWVSRAVPRAFAAQTSVRKLPDEFARAFLVILQGRFEPLRDKDLDGVTLVSHPMRAGSIFVIVSKGKCAMSASPLPARVVQGIMVSAQKSLV